MPSVTRSIASPAFVAVYNLPTSRRLFRILIYLVMYASLQVSLEHHLRWRNPQPTLSPMGTAPSVT